MTKTAHFYFKLILGIFIAFLIGIYAIYQSKNLLRGPELSIETPQNGTTITENIARVSGYAKNISKITLNGRQIFTDEIGFFSEEVLASTGYNIWKIEVQDKFDRHAEKTVEIIYLPPKTKG